MAVHFQRCLHVLLLIVAISVVSSAAKKKQTKTRKQAAVSGGGGGAQERVQDPKCLQPKEPGPCRMNMESYYYNAKTNTCEKFIFGGCHGNDNRFRLLKTCEDACLQPKTATNNAGGDGGAQERVQDPKCLQPKEPGLCRMYIESYYYNAKTNTCEKFIFGGCHGNDNRFRLLKTCEDACLLPKTATNNAPAGKNSKPNKKAKKRKVRQRGRNRYQIINQKIIFI